MQSVSWLFAGHKIKRSDGTFLIDASSKKGGRGGVETYVLSIIAAKRRVSKKSQNLFDVILGSFIDDIEKIFLDNPPPLSY